MFRTIFTAPIRFLFPPECVGCGDEDEWICKHCKQHIQDSINPEKIKTQYIQKLWVLGDYQNKILSEALSQLKFGHSRDIIDDLEAIIVHALKEIKLPRKATLVPIPLHWRRKFERGFNQSELIAEVIQKQKHYDINKRLLRRLRYTTPQTKLPPLSRRSNLENAFYLPPRRMPTSEVIILIDDVGTTLSTLEHAAKTFEQAGYVNIMAIVVARSQ